MPYKRGCIAWNKGLKGSQHHTTESREKIRQAMIKRTGTEEWREKVRSQFTKLWSDPEFRERMSHRRIYVRTKAHRQRIRESNLQRDYSFMQGENNPMYGSHRAGEQNPFYGKSHTMETCEKLRLLFSNGSRVREQNSNWRGGISFGPYSVEWNEKLKKQIRDRDDHLCQMPGCYVSENGRKHDVHHIDYDKKHNDQVNLITLCLPHHTITSNGDRDHWTELFQELQRQRLNELRSVYEAEGFL